MSFPAFPVCACVKVWVKEKAKKGRVVKNPGVDVPGGLVVKTPRFHCRGPGSIPGRGSSACRAVRCGQNNKQNNNNSTTPWGSQHRAEGELVCATHCGTSLPGMRTEVCGLHQNGIQDW